MTLESRLSRLQTQAGAKFPQREDARSVVNSSLSKRLARLQSHGLEDRAPKCNHRLSDQQLVEALNAEVIGDGLFRIEQAVPFSQHLGSVCLEVLDDIPLLPGETGMIPGVYIDTETTGLSGGSGTIAFLVGAAVIGEKNIRLTQFLMTKYVAEAALLRAFEKSIPKSYRLISYNGKSYDIPLLLTRFRMQGISTFIGERKHLDLLHPVRRLFSKRWENCRLISVEEQLLGFYRRGDLPGSKAPEAWFSYLRNGDAQDLIKVVKHNQQDILSLAAAHALLGRVAGKPALYRADLYSLARWISEHDETHALELLNHNQDSLCDDSSRLLAHLLRRAGRWDEAVTVWKKLANHGCVESIEHLAKYHEHVTKDLRTASTYCRQLPGSKADIHRQNRLQNKLAIAEHNLALSPFLPI